MTSKLFDKICGCIMGHALGDALGAPSEFKPYSYYLGKLEFPITRYSRNYGKRVSPVGQITDDAEMAMALLYSLEKGWNKNRTIIEYMTWANNRGFQGNQPFMGKNTRDLFLIGNTSKIKTSLYDSRFKKAYSTKKSMEDSQSNGALMRSYPLAFVNKHFASLDCSITNPSSVTKQAVKVYTNAIRNALLGKSKKQIIKDANDSINIDVLRVAFDQATTNTFRNVTENRGWVVHAFYCAFWGFINFDNYEDAINAIICLGPNVDTSQICKKKRTDNVIIGDTDTNAAIAGALLGAYYGILNMCKNHMTKYNMRILIRVDPMLGDFKRPERYTMNKNNFFKLAKIALNLCNKSVDKSIVKSVDKSIVELFYPDGKLKSQSRYKNGKKNGEEKEWYDNGMLKLQTYYKNGKKNGEEKEWYDNGMLKLQTYYKDSEIDGLYKVWYKNGKLKENIMYDNGAMTGEYTEWFENSNKKNNTFYKDNIPIGEFKEWYENSQLKLSKIYKNGKLNGKYNEWYENGQLREKFNMNNGEINGLFEAWTGDGKPIVKTMYKDGILHGKNKEWIGDKLVVNNIYKNGKIIY